MHTFELSWANVVVGSTSSRTVPSGPRNRSSMLIEDDYSFQSRTGLYSKNKAVVKNSQRQYDKLDKFKCYVQM